MAPRNPDKRSRTRCPRASSARRSIGPRYEGAELRGRSRPPRSSGAGRGEALASGTRCRAETAARPSRAAPRRGTTWGQERGPDPKLRRLRRPLAVAITSRSLDAANARSGAGGTARTASGNLGNRDELTSRLTFCFPPPRPGRSSPRGTPPPPARHQQPQDSVGTMTNALRHSAQRKAHAREYRCSFRHKKRVRGFFSYIF